MRPKNALLTGALALSLLAGKPARSQVPATIINNPSMSVEHELDEKVLASYRLLKEDDEVGKVCVRAHSIEATVYWSAIKSWLPDMPLMRILFYSPSEQVYIEDYDSPLGHESFVYEDGDRLRLSDYRWPTFGYREEKDALVGTTMPKGTKTPLDLFEDLMAGTETDTTRLVVLGIPYRVLLTENDSLPGGRRDVGVEFLDLKKEKNDKLYLEDPGKGVINEEGVIEAAHLVLTSVKYHHGEREEKKMPVTLQREWLDERSLIEAYAKRDSTND